MRPAVLERFLIEIDLPGEFAKGASGQVFLVFIDHIVHIPELPLQGRSFTRYRGLKGERMPVWHRIMTKDEFQEIAKTFLDDFYDEVGFGAILTFEIAILDQFDRSEGTAGIMIMVRSEVYMQLAHNSSFKIW